jgi:hypothetical protein
VTLVGVGLNEEDEAGNRESFAGSGSSLTVGDTAWVRLLRLADSEDDILLSIRLALLVFFSAFSSLRDDVEPAVGGGERPFWWLVRSLLEIDSRLLSDILGDWWTDGGREGDFIGDFNDGEEISRSTFIDRRRSLMEVRVSLINSRTIVMEDLRSLVVVAVVLDASESRLSFERRLSWIVSFWGCKTAFWWSIIRGDCLRSNGA